MNSDCERPLNLGTEEMLSMNAFAELALSFEGKKVPIKHIPGPQGVRGRNSDNKMIRDLIGWEPSISLKDGLRKTYFWIKGEMEMEQANGVDISMYASSKVVVQALDSLEKVGKSERPKDKSDTADKVQYRQGFRS